MDFLDLASEEDFDNAGVITAGECLALIEKEMPEVIAFDSESEHYYWWREDVNPFCFTLSWSKEHTYLLECMKWADDEETAGVAGLFWQLFQWAQDGKITLVAHNTKYDLHVVQRLFREAQETLGIMPNLLDMQTPYPYIQDTMIMSHCLNENRSHALKNLCDAFDISFGDSDASKLQEQVQGWIAENSKASGKEMTYADVPRYLMVPYAIQDAYLTLELYNRFKAEMEKTASKERKDLDDIYALEMELLWVLYEAEEIGMAVDMEFVFEQQALLTPQVDDLKQKCVDVAGVSEVDGQPFDPRKTEHLVAGLKAIGKFDKKKCTNPYNGNLNIPEWVLSDIDHEFPQTVLKFREVDKIVNSYYGTIRSFVKNYDGQDTVHCNFKQIGARTGRMSVTEPALQTLPRKKGNVRGAFVSREGHDLIFVDYAQQELRVMAHYMKKIGDPTMADIFDEGSIDLHLVTSAEMFDKPNSHTFKPDWEKALEAGDEGQVLTEERTAAKNVNFAMSYGAGQAKLAQMMNVDLERGKQLLERYHKLYPGVRKLKMGTQSRMKRKGFVVTVFGRRHRCVDMKQAYKAPNSLIQGTSADLTKRAMVRVTNALKAEGLASRVVMSVHDEIIVESPESETERVLEIMDKEMTHCPEITVPLEVDANVAKRWSDAK